MIEYKTGTEFFTKKDILSLYTDAGWFAYTKDMPKLLRGIQNSNLVISAWSENRLVGLLRTISDNETIVYIQDVLVLKEFKKQKIGTTLINMVLEKSKNIRQIVLLTDAKDNTSCSFYNSLDFKSCDDGETVAFIKN